jgi:APA family basic amino acid/polyamine antiporter
MPVAHGGSAGAATPLAQGPPGGYRNAPMLGIVNAVPPSVVATGLRYLVGLVVATVLIAVASAAVRRCGRLAHWLGEHSQLPRSAAALHPRHRTPYLALAASGAAALALVAGQALGGGLDLLVGVWAYAALMALTLVQVAVIALRRSDPGRYRSFATPIALPIAGGLLTPAGWMTLVVLGGGARDVASASIVGGLPGFCAYRHHRGLPLREVTQPEPVVPAGPGIEVEFQTMLVPVNTADGNLPGDVVEVALQLAAERRAWLVVLAFTEIPLGEEMDMEIEGLDGCVERLAAGARAIGERYGIRVHTTHLRTRDAADTILAEAARRESQLILLRAAGRERTARRQVAYNHVVRRILAEATQRVMIVRSQAVKP